MTNLPIGAISNSRAKNTIIRKGIPGISTDNQTMKTRPVPILIGAAQYTQRKDANPVLDPLGLMVKASLHAMRDAGSDALKSIIDTVCVINSFSRDDECLPLAVSGSLGIRPENVIYSQIGGNSPQTMVNRLARDIAAGRKRAVLLTGAEAIYSMHKASKGKTVLDWQDNVTLRHLREKNLPVNFDTLLRSGANMRKKCSRQRAMSTMKSTIPLKKPTISFCRSSCILFSKHPFAIYPAGVSGNTSSIWDTGMNAFPRLPFRIPMPGLGKNTQAEELTIAAPQNRYVVYPYTVRIVANINVDQSAALIMTNDADADALGIDRSKWVYPMGGAELNNIWHVTERPRLYDSPPITEAARLALEQSGLSLSDIGVFDLYSCFPSAVEISRQAIGISEDDPRDLTVTGGLAQFGGPGNNYTMHAIASVVERIRRDRRLKAMVTANGWYNSKHAIGIYGAEPPDHPWEDRDDSAVQKAIDAEALPAPSRTGRRDSDDRGVHNSLRS